MSLPESVKAKFYQPGTRLKIKPESYIHFDGTEFIYLRNVMCEDSLRIKYDILLILIELVNWITVADLIDPWPPDDQEKIMKYLEQMYQAKILMFPEDEQGVGDVDVVTKGMGSHIHINVENHHAMLRDYVRLAAYRRAIERAVGPDTVAMDLGCGSGILSFFAAQGGAKKIYAIERRPDIILLAQELAKANGYENIEFIEGSSHEISPSKLSDPKPNLFISEILGNGILEENVLEFTLDARNRFLAEGGKMIPARLEIYVFAFESEIKQDRWQEVQEFKDLYGVDFTLLGQVLCNKATLRLDRYNTMLNKTLSEPLKVTEVNFETIQNPIFNTKFNLVAKEDGNMTGFCAYFKAYLDDTTTLTNSPWAPQTHWTQLVYTLPYAKPVKAGEVVPMLIYYDGTLRIRLAEEVEETASS